MTPRREMVVALVVLAAGAAVALVCAGRPRVAVSGASQVTGATTPAAAALALVAVAGVGAVLLVRPWARMLIGALLVVVGAGLVYVFSARSGDVGWAAYTPGAREVRTSAWAWLGMVAGALVAVAAAATALRGRRWPAGRDRYEATAARRAGRPRDAWEALDRGEDPTT